MYECGNDLLSLYSSEHSVDDLHHSIQAFRMAAKSMMLTDKHSACLSKLGFSLLRCFQRTGDKSQISEAIALQRKAVELTPPEDADLPRWLCNLGLSLKTSFEASGDQADLVEAIATERRGVTLAEDSGDHYYLPVQMGNLGSSLTRRFEMVGDLSDISEAISLQQRATQLTREGDADIPRLWNSVGISFLRRFERTSDMEDLKESIASHRRAVDLTKDNDSDMPSRLNNLGICLMRYFESDPDLFGAALSEAISVQQKAIDLTPNHHVHLPNWLCNLGLSLRCRERSGDPMDLSKAISYQERAVTLTSDESALLPRRLNNLGISLMRRYERGGEDAVNLILEAISIQSRAVQLTPDGHPHKCLWLCSLGASAQSFLERTSDPIAGALAGEAFRLAALHQGGTPSIRLIAADRWADFLLWENKSAHSMDAYGLAIELLPEVASMDQTIATRHHNLLKISQITTRAAATALSCERIDLSLEWLEQGRCLVWNQLNQLRTPLEELQRHSPHHVEQYIRISRELDALATRDMHSSSNLTRIDEKISLQDRAAAHIKLTEEWASLLKSIRKTPGGEHFLRQPRAANLLQNLPVSGVVILVNVDKTRSDALVLRARHDTPVHIKLGGFTYEEASHLRDEFRKYLKYSNIRVRSDADERGPRDVAVFPSKGFLQHVLERLWVGVAKPVFDILGLSVSFNIAVGII